MIAINFDYIFPKQLNGAEKNDSIGDGRVDDLGKIKIKIDHNEQGCAGLSITSLYLGSHDCFIQNEEVAKLEIRDDPYFSLSNWVIDFEVSGQNRSTNTDQIWPRIILSQAIFI